MPAKRKYANEITSYSPHRVRRQPLWHTAGWLLILIGHNYWHTYARALFGQSMRYTFAVVLPHVRARDIVVVAVVVAVGSSQTATGSAHFRASRRDLYLSLVALLCRSQTCIQPLYDLSIYANYCDGFCSNVHMCLIFIIRSDPCRRSGN